MAVIQQEAHPQRICTRTSAAVERVMPALVVYVFSRKLDQHRLQEWTSRMDTHRHMHAEASIVTTPQIMCASMSRVVASKAHGHGHACVLWSP